MLSNFYLLDAHNKTRVAFGNMQRNICKKPDWNLDLPLFHYDVMKYMSVDFLTVYIGPPSCVHYWVWNS